MLLYQRKAFNKLFQSGKNGKKPQRLFLRICKGQCNSKQRTPTYCAQHCPLETKNIAN